MFKLRPGAVVGVFTDRAQAQQAMDTLVQAGFRPDQIEVTVQEAVETPGHTNRGSLGLKARGGAALGGILGGIIGCLVGALAGTGMVGGIGPLFGGSGLGGLVAALIGLIVGALLGGLIGMGLTEDQDSFFARELQSGRTILAVQANGRSTEAADILRRHQAYGIRTPNRVPVAH